MSFSHGSKLGRAQNRDKRPGSLLSISRERQVVVQGLRFKLRKRFAAEKLPPAQGCTLQLNFWKESFFILGSFRSGPRGVSCDCSGGAADRRESLSHAERSDQLED